MGEIIRIDARGLSCPEPAMLTQQALKRASQEGVEVRVDSASARDNVSRLARMFGWKVEVEETPEGDWRLQLRQ